MSCSENDTKCKCGGKPQYIVMDSEVGPELVCSSCAVEIRNRGNVNEATVFSVTPIVKLKYKANNWLDAKAHKVLYGIDVKMNGTWHHASADNQPLFFDTAEERDAKIVELRKAL